MLCFKQSFLSILIVALFSSQSAGETLSIPLNAKGSWEILNYSKIPANKVSFDKDGLNVRVNKSSSPLIYPFNDPEVFEEAQILIKTTSQLNLKKSVPQGDGVNDDFLFRIGFVIEGERTLNFLQKSIAPDWVTKLFSLADGKAKGVHSIQFYNLVQMKSLQGKKRQHPLSDLIYEHYQWVETEAMSEYLLNTGKIKFPGKVIALWISIDGDDSQSIYSVLIKEIKLTKK